MKTSITSPKRMIERAVAGTYSWVLGNAKGMWSLAGLEGDGYYDEYGELSFGLMFHGFDYPSDTGKPELVSRFGLRS